VERRLYTLDPLSDPRWPGFVLSHAGASICHTPGWLRALQRTYRYEPSVLTTSSPTEELQSGAVFCLVRSWLTGNRLVSLPFSDHCEPLADGPEELDVLLRGLSTKSREQHCRQLEVRSVTPLAADKGLERAQEFFFHRLDLRPGHEAVFRSFHKDCVRRKIRRAERERLTWQEGRSKSLLNQFYHLQVISRRRQQLPPQPLSWFRNLIDCLGDQLNIGVASKNGQPIAAIMTLRFRDILTYKYGCSDHRFYRLGGMQLLLWKAIEQAISMGLREFDMGRSDLDSPGLVIFKDRWGAVRSRLAYWACPARSASVLEPSWKLGAARRILAHSPSTCLALIGRLLYRHIG
jgi:hypothetical protein